MMDSQPITEADLETGSVSPPSPDMPDSSPITEDDLAPATGGPAGPTGEFAYKGIPAAAAARFKASNPLTNIFGAAVTKAVNGYANAFQTMTAADQQTLIENGYGNYNQGFPGSLLQHAADMFNSGLTLTVDGFLALGPAFSEGVGGIEGQIARETGAPEDVAQSAEREGGFIGQAVQSDVGAMHAAAMLDAAKANAAVAGAYGHAYRFDVTPEGDAVATPLGRLPADGTEAQHQAEVAANALHLPPETATLIHQTYLDTGRPPAEVLMDAQTNHGGVLDDLVAGKVPTVYQGPPRALTPEELAAAKPPEGATAPEAAGAPQPTQTTPAGATEAPAPTGISKIGQSIEAKAVEDGLTKGFGQTAGYDKITIADQAARTTALINEDLDKARAVIRGEEPLPSGMKGTALITAMEEYIKKNPNADLAYELANSPLVSATSEAAQELRLAAERTPDSATAMIQELRQAQERAAGGKKAVAARRAAVKEALPEAQGVLLPKEMLSIDRFLDAIKC